MKCKHGMHSEEVCSICKDWPSVDRMRQSFPGISDDKFLIMRPEERLAAIKTGVMTGLPVKE